MTAYVREQYRDSSNLTARSDLHARFSTNRQDWLEWAFENLELKRDSNVLEVGCGTGEIWGRNLRDVPLGCEIMLTDLSPGMASEAYERLLADLRFGFSVCDAQLLPFADEVFDCVIANHMLYHVPDRRRAFGEVRRVLKPGGRLIAATNGHFHMRELRDMLERVSPGTESEPVAGGGGFSLENGAEQLREWFTDVTVTRRDDSLVITDADALVAYALSINSYDLSGDRVHQLAELVEREIAINGRFRVTKDVGLFRAHKSPR